MDTEHHRLALAAVQGRLRQRFPHVDATVVEAAVRLSHAELTGHGDGFIPQLVERAAHNRLSYALPEQPLTASPDQPVPAANPRRAALGTSPPPRSGTQHPVAGMQHGRSGSREA